MASGNPPEVIEQAKQTRAVFLKFRDWLAQRELAENQEESVETILSGISKRDQAVSNVP